ncbi:MAG: carboxylating nicotinate-nucleotide diphosphorylase [Pseudomonadota bacterium]
MTDIAPLPHVILEPLVRRALEEDLGRAGDITSACVIPAEANARMVMAARQEGVIAGLDAAEIAFKLVDPSLTVRRLKAEGADVNSGDAVMEIEGCARSLLAAERVALNFVGHMSGIATLTRRMAGAVGAHKTKICSTRKTTPGLCSIEKYAVRVGGGMNHRLGLDDAILIKDNHIAVAGGVAIALRRAKGGVGHMVRIEIEVDTLAQLKEVLGEGVDVVMLDNMSLEDMAAAVKMVGGRAVVEASGGVTLERIAKIAATGVDVISVGALTHSAPHFDVGLDFKACPVNQD